MSLNLPLIQERQKLLGLSGPALASACEVSREAVSNWLRGESVPRPSKLVQLARTLEVSVAELLGVAAPPPAPVIAYRTKLNREVTDEAAQAAEGVAQHLRRLVPLFPAEPRIESPRDAAPQALNSHVRRVATEMREKLGLSPMEVVCEEHVLTLLRHFGAVLVPVLWGRDKERHENALSVYLPESGHSFVVFNLDCKADDYLYWLSHEFGHCLSLHKLQGKPGEDYAELFAQHFLFPDEAAHACAEEMGAGSWKFAMDVAIRWAVSYGISLLTIVRRVDAIRATRGMQKLEGDKHFWYHFHSHRTDIPSWGDVICEGAVGSVAQYVEIAERHYKTPVLKALEALQVEDGGRNPQGIQGTLMIPIAQAVDLSLELWKRRSA